MKGTKLELNDYRGSIPAQKLLWPKAIQDADGIIWVVDADKEKLFSQSAELLKTTLGGRSLPILIYANKMDIPSAQPESKIKPYFAEFSNCFVQSASVVNFDGLWEGIQAFYQTHYLIFRNRYWMVNKGSKSCNQSE